jgi:hypothetical protein
MSVRGGQGCCRPWQSRNFSARCRASGDQRCQYTLQSPEVFPEARNVECDQSEVPEPRVEEGALQEEGEMAGARSPWALETDLHWTLDI